jgi:hypothetical protein
VGIEVGGVHLLALKLRRNCGRFVPFALMAPSAPIRLTCDCGFVANRNDDNAFVAVAQAHSLEAHGVETPWALLLLLRSQTESGGAGGEGR